MNVTIRKTFEKDTLKLPALIKHRLVLLIKTLRNAITLSKIANCKKLNSFKNAYRIRIGEYRIGFFVEKNSIDLVRVLPRKQMYPVFPLKFYSCVSHITDRVEDRRLKIVVSFNHDILTSNPTCIFVKSSKIHAFVIAK